MKKFKLLSFLLLLTVGLVLPSCSDDDDSVSNSFVFDGDTFDLENGFIAEVGSNGEINGTETFNFDVFLTSESITTGGQFRFTGTGDFLNLDLNTNSSTGLVAGTYTWSNVREDFSIVDGSVNTDFNTGTFTGDSVDATGGSVEVEINGNEVTFNVNLQTAGGGTVTGFYQGNLKRI